MGVATLELKIHMLILRLCTFVLGQKWEENKYTWLNCWRSTQLLIGCEKEALCRRDKKMTVVQAVRSLSWHIRFYQILITGTCLYYSRQSVSGITRIDTIKGTDQFIKVGSFINSHTMDWEHYNTKIWSRLEDSTAIWCNMDTEYIINMRSRDSITCIMGI